MPTVIFNVKVKIRSNYSRKKYIVVFVIIFSPQREIVTFFRRGKKYRSNTCSSRRNTEKKTSRTIPGMKYAGRATSHKHSRATHINSVVPIAISLRRSIELDSVSSAYSRDIPLDNKLSVHTSELKNVILVIIFQSEEDSDILTAMNISLHRVIEHEVTRNSTSN